jgi:transcriptional regulator with XRE-family HTH domain
VDLGELGAFLRSRRDRLRPAHIGLATHGRRRVSGLRRDEVAERAHLSTDYYIELERGNAHPSAAVLGTLAGALQLTGDERAYLYLLAGRPQPPTRSAPTLLPAMRDLLGRFGEVPAYVTTDLQVVLAQNAAATELHGPMPDPAEPTSSYVHRWFTDPAVRAHFASDHQDAEARALIADLRIGTAHRGPADVAAATLVATLRQESPWFAELWGRHEVAVRRAETKRLNHPRSGPTDYECHALVSEDASQRLIWYVPAAAGR